jgi:prepilin signal peptidase PulO-like enzyme (type II secretory pathway)
MAGNKIKIAVIALVVIIVSIRLIDPLANAVADVSGLAILGSFGGTSALINVIMIIAVAGVLVAAVELAMPGTTASVARRVRGRR